MNYLRFRGGNPGALFVHENGEPLSRSQLVAWVRDATALLHWVSKGTIRDIQ